METEGVYSTIKSFPRDFGLYYEVVCYFDPEDRDSVDYAYRCETGKFKQIDLREAKDERL